MTEKTSTRLYSNGIQISKLELPTDVHGTSPTEVSFIFKGYKYEFTVHIPNKLIQATFRNPRKIYAPPGLDHHEIWRQYYQTYVSDPEQNEFYDIFLAEFQKIREKRHLDDDEFVELLVAYVQQLPYHFAKLTNPNRHTYYPVETVSLGTGVCEDKGLLLAALLSRSGYDSAYIILESAHHAVTGIRVQNGAGYQGSGYAFIETTLAGSRIGDERGNTVPAKIYPVGSGKKQYTALDDMQHIGKCLNTIKDQISTGSTLSQTIKLKKERLSGIREKRKERKSMIREYERAQKNSVLSDTELKQYHLLVSQYQKNLEAESLLVREINELVERRKLLRTIRAYANHDPTNRKGILDLLNEHATVIGGMV